MNFIRMGLESSDSEKRVDEVGDRVWSSGDLASRIASLLGLCCVVWRNLTGDLPLAVLTDLVYRSTYSTSLIQVISATFGRRPL